jgi:release factor glutamine methyltransferase
VSTRESLQSDVAARLGSASEARWLIEEVLGRSGAPAVAVGPAAEATLTTLVARRLAGDPLQYVLGSWGFRTLDLVVDERALIPRPETEQVVEVAIAEIRRRAAGTPRNNAGVEKARAGTAGPVLVDLGTGTGAIALSVAVELHHELGGLEVWATDVDRDALALAACNRARVGTAFPWAARRVRLRAGSWFDALPSGLAGRIDVVVSNPPYVSEEEWASLDPEVRREPRRALVAGAGSDGMPGLAAVEAVIVGAVGWLAPGGVLVVELAPHQAERAGDLARRLGYRDVRVATDLSGRDRAVVGRR